VIVLSVNTTEILVQWKIIYFGELIQIQISVYLELPYSLCSKLAFFYTILIIFS